MININHIICQVSNLMNRYRTRNPFELCNCLHIRISYKNLGTDVRAYFFCQSRIKNVVLSADESEEMRRILCAHELGHAILHEKIARKHGFAETGLFNCTSVTEDEANIFAAELLIDDNDLLRLAKDSEKTFFDIAKELYVPVELLDVKCHILKSKNFPVNQMYIYQTKFLKSPFKYS